jgi:hypothetical protein
MVSGAITFKLTTLLYNDLISAGYSLAIFNSVNKAGLLTLPTFSLPSINLGYGAIQNPTDDFSEIQGVKTSAPDWLCLFAPTLCLDRESVELPNGVVGEAILSLGSFFKKFWLLTFATVLLIFGLYLLAKSTDTGKAVINVASKI